jgi:hypothetical protein
MKIIKQIFDHVNKLNDDSITKMLQERPGQFYITPRGKKCCILLPDGRLMVMVGPNFKKLTAAEINTHFQKQIQKFM